jgi:hypothetical protein
MGCGVSRDLALADPSTSLVDRDVKTREEDVSSFRIADIPGTDKDNCTKLRPKIASLSIIARTEMRKKWEKHCVKRIAVVLIATRLKLAGALPRRRAAIANKESSGRGRVPDLIWE